MANTWTITFNVNAVQITDNDGDIVTISPIVERENLKGQFVSLEVLQSIAMHCNNGGKMIVKGWQ